MASRDDAKPKPASPKVTAKHVAAAVGLDPSAVYQVLSGRGRISEAKRKEVLDAAERLGYHTDPLAKRLRLGRGAKDVPIISFDLDRGVLVRTVLALQRLLTTQGFQSPVHHHWRTGGSSSLAHFRRVFMERPLAVISTESVLDEETLAEVARYQAGGGLFITVGIPSPAKCDQVAFSEFDNTRLAAGHLLDLGHRAIAFATQMDCTVEEPRVQGLIQAHRDRGLEWDARWLLPGGMYEEGGVRAAKRFLELYPRPTAAAIVNDISAIAFMNELMRSGLRIPADASVIGHDGLPEAVHSLVRLSTVTRPSLAMAEAAVAVLEGRLGGTISGPWVTKNLAGEVQLGESTAPLGGLL